MALCRMRASFLDQLEAWKVELTSKTDEIVAGKVGDCWVWGEEGEKEGGVRRQGGRRGTRGGRIGREGGRDN